MIYRDRRLCSPFMTQRGGRESRLGCRQGSVADTEDTVREDKEGDLDRVWTDTYLAIPS